MTDITIPPAALEAACRAYELYVYDCVSDDAMRLAIAAALNAWPAAAEIERLRAEVERLTKDLKMAVMSDSEECKALTSEVERLVTSRNRWGQKYNKLLLKIRAGLGEADDPVSWQLRVALDDSNVKNDEQAARIEQLRALLTPKLLDENAPKDRMLIGLERPPCEEKTYYSMVQWREDTQQWMMEAGVDWSVSPGRRVWAFCGVSHYIDPLELPDLPYWDGKDEEDGDDE